MSFGKLSATSACLIFLALPAAAQMSANPPNIGEEIRNMGARMGPNIVRTTNRLYGPLLKNMPRDGVKVTANRSYGDHQRHVLDIYQPQNSEGALPVVVFFHGGGLVRGDKKSYVNIGTFFARHGIVGITANYRLAPEAKWPNGAEDVAGTIKWIKANAAGYGIDADRIFLMGSSAGAVHVSGYAFFEDNQLENDGVAGAILVSLPNVDLVKKAGSKGAVLRSRGEKAYYGTDPGRYPSMSPINTIAGRVMPLYIAYAELDPPGIQGQNLLLIQALHRRDKLLPTVKQAQGHNHISIIRHFNTKDEALGLDIIEFVKAH